MQPENPNGEGWELFPSLQIPVEEKAEMLAHAAQWQADQLAEMDAEAETDRRERTQLYWFLGVALGAALVLLTLCAYMFAGMASH